jgi:hypothetical protein
VNQRRVHANLFIAWLFICRWVIRPLAWTLIIPCALLAVPWWICKTLCGR